MKSRVLDTKVQQGFSQIDEALFNEGVTIKDGARDASGPTMAYNVAKGEIALTGPVVPGKPSTRVDDERATIQAQRIDWTLDGKNMVADGDVKSVMKASKEKPAAGAPGAAAAPPLVRQRPRRRGREAGASGQKPAQEIKRPGILKDSEPTNVTSKHLVYNSETGHADYTGDAWLWQAETSIKADTIVVDENSGNLTANGNVRSTMRLEPREEGAKPERSRGQRCEAGGAGAKPAARRATGEAGRIADHGDRDRSGVRRRAAARDLHDERADGRARGRPQGGQDRAVSRRDRTRAAASGGVYEGDVPDRDAEGRAAPRDGRAAHVFRERGALRDERSARARDRADAAGMPRNYGQNFDILQGD